ncbi:MAG: hypothetical protein AB8B69_19120 [Chitinophagales bacterium]
MKFLRFIYILGLLFWASILIYSISQLFALNGLGEVFEVATPQKVNTIVKHDSSFVNIEYDYIVGGNIYRSRYKIALTYYNRHKTDSIKIKYNTLFPSVSYIEGIPLKIRKQKIDIFISIFFITFLSLLWNLSNKEKWIERYKKIGT